MASTWTGSALLTRFLQKYGLSDTTSSSRMLEWMNEIQSDIAASFNWPFLKFKLKKYVAANSQEVYICPQIPDVSVLSETTSGGTLANGSVYYVKTSFLIFGEDHLNREALESEPSVASSSITITSATSKISATLDTYRGDSSISPSNIHRIVYLKKDSGDYYYYTTVTNNSASTVDITSDTTSTIEPPESETILSMASEDILIEASGRYLDQVKLDDIIKYDPNLTTTGTPQYYARITPYKILVYPKPSAALTLSYWVFRKPWKIFNDSTRAVQLDEQLKNVLDAGVVAKSYEYRDREGQDQKLQNYEMLKAKSFRSKTNTNSQSQKVRIVV